MSRAGVYSNRGDYFQILIAIHWIVRMLETEDIAAIQVDSTGLPDHPGDVAVDDVVVRNGDGTYRFIQAKKNQENCRAWSFSDLKDELKKAWTTFGSHPDSIIEFCSQTPFGDLESLRESCAVYRGEYSIFKQHAPESNKKLLRKLAGTIGIHEEEAFSLVRHMRFGDALKMEGWESNIHVRLENRFAGPDLDPDALFRILIEQVIRHESALTGSRSEILRGDLLDLLEEKGFFLSLYRNMEEILEEFGNASLIGRSWPRDIAGERIPTPQRDRIMNALGGKARTVLVTGGPGSGKTCVLFDVAECLEADAAFAVLFIKTDRFEGISSESDLAEMKMPADIPGKCARLAHSKKVVVLLDSLDVLSLNRDRRALNVFLGLMERLQRIENVSIVASCRSFDIEYDPLLRGRKWQETVGIGDLDFDSQVRPLLHKWGIDVASMPEKLKRLLCTPQMLKMYSHLVRNGKTTFDLSTPYELFERFVRDLIEENPSLGHPAVEALQKMAFDLLERRGNGYDGSEFAHPELIPSLCSLGVLQSPNGNRLEFGHQTLLESFSIREALQERLDLDGFIRRMAPLPFIRTSIRAYFLYLRTNLSERFQRQVRKVLNDTDIAYHIKRLIVESLSEIVPGNDDWNLVRELTGTSPDLFERFLWRTRNDEWFFFLKDRWLPHVRNNESRSLISAFYEHLKTWLDGRPSEVLTLWLEALDGENDDLQRVRSSIVMLLEEFKHWSLPEAKRILVRLLEICPEHEIQYLGKPLSRFVKETNSGDDLLWAWITRNLTTDSRNNFWNIRAALTCEEHDFCTKTFFYERMSESESLLNMAIDAVSKWIRDNEKRFDRNGLSSDWLEVSSWKSFHERNDMTHVDSSMELMGALEAALLNHSKRDTAWWNNNKMRLARSPALAFRYFLILAIEENVGANLDVAAMLLRDTALWHSRKLDYELGKLMNRIFLFLDEATWEEIQRILLEIPEESAYDGGSFRYWAWFRVCTLLSWIPAHCRLPEAQRKIEKYKSVCLPYPRTPECFSVGGFVFPPFSVDDFLGLSDSCIRNVLEHYDGYSGDEWNLDAPVIIGGKDEVLNILRNAAELDPTRFLRLLPIIHEALHDIEFTKNIVDGVGSHLLHRTGVLQTPATWIPRSGEDVMTLARDVFDVVARSPDFWRGKREGAQVIEGCSSVFDEQRDIERLVSLMSVFRDADDPKVEENPSELEDTGISSVRGIVADSAMVLANRLLEMQQGIPEVLRELILFFSSDSHSAVRVMLLRRLPYCISKAPVLGWDVLDRCLEKKDPRLWPHVERCLYYQLRDHFEEAKLRLSRWKDEGLETGGEGWGRLMALCCLYGHVTLKELFETIADTRCVDAWKGVVHVLCANISGKSLREKCEAGLLEVLEIIRSGRYTGILETFVELFRDEKALPSIAPEIVIGILECLKNPDTREPFHLFAITEWFAFLARENPRKALQVGETMLSLIEADRDAAGAFLGSGKDLCSALVEILREADQSDDPVLIRSAVELQDGFLKYNVGVEKVLEYCSKAD